MQCLTGKVVLPEWRKLWAYKSNEATRTLDVTETAFKKLGTERIKDFINICQLNHSSGRTVDR